MCLQIIFYTPSISHGLVNKDYEGYNKKTGIHIHADSREKNELVNKKSTEIINSIKNHIKKIPIVESHYCYFNIK